MPATGEGARGFTLFEMLVVLAVLGLIGGLAYPALGRAARAQALASATAGAALRDARARALRGDRAVAVGVDDAGLRVADDPARPWPAGVAAAVRPAAGIVFLPDGTSPGGELAVATAGATRRWRVVPATGVVEPGG